MQTRTTSDGLMRAKIYDSRTHRGYDDLRRALANPRLIWLLAFRDIQARYRRSMLGPFWITISMTGTVLGMSFVFSTIMNRGYDDYVPYLAVGMALWAMISGIVAEGANSLIQAAAMVKYTTQPLATHMLRHQLHQLIFFAHNIVPGLVLCLLLGKTGLAGIAASLAGLLLTFVAVSSLGFFAALVSVRFRDIPQIATNLMQVFFFLTPIIWPLAAIGDRTYVLDYNPFYSMVTIVREPLLGIWPPAHAWFIVGGVAVLGWLAVAVIYERIFDRLSKWV
ncbi:MAG TPA: ABC transporter permease [Rhizobiaceae bacterium]|nr:ABC transporter permease [Rhizobiaceae bacterium]